VLQFSQLTLFIISLEEKYGQETQVDALLAVRDLRARLRSPDGLLVFTNLGQHLVGSAGGLAYLVADRCLVCGGLLWLQVVSWP